MAFLSTVLATYQGKKEFRKLHEDGVEGQKWGKSLSNEKKKLKKKLKPWSRSHDSHGKEMSREIPCHQPASQANACPV